MKKNYWVMWTYIANFSEPRLVGNASSPEDAIDIVTGHFSEDFKKKGTVYVFDKAPVFVRKPA